jgi:hypothetical protein
MNCRVCHNPTHLVSGSVRCNGCDHSPAFCRCQSVAQFIPVWMRRARESRYGLAKDFSGQAA